MDDAALVHAWRSGDASAGERLVERHFPAVYGFFRHKVGGDVEDLVQRTFLRCVEARDAFRGESSFRTYLFAIARNELFGHWRRRGLDVDPDATASGVLDAVVGPASAIDARREYRLLVQALRGLPLDDQIALELMYFEELTGAEIAVVLGVPEGTARTRLRRARLALERSLAALDAAGEGLRVTTDDIERWAGAMRDAMRQERAARR
ncbi:MAG: sigma-70 family RNA polymerase sigma factor [Deltaproteobacteria bacterium]|nr:sigma-70 family RNA polymerase sigma factor [Deltaproteobacteria bacterium]